MATKTTNTANTTVEEFSWDDMREIRMRKYRPGEAKSEYVSINGRTFMVPKSGKVETVPYPVYERLMIMEAARDEYAAMLEDVPNEG